MKIMRFGVVLGLAAVTAAVLGVATARASVQDFTISQFNATYTLHKGSDGVATMDVLEDIAARFPDFDQNHGILRALPEVYDDHTLELGDITVTNQAKTPYRYESYSENDNTVLKIGDADTYVHGNHSYYINYKLRGVIKDFGDHQELYWNVNGAQWSQEFENIGAQVVLADGLEQALLPQKACYIGAAGSKTPCSATYSADGKSIDFSTPDHLLPHQTMTMVLSFKAGTFAAYKPSPAEMLKRVLQGLVLAVPPLLATAVAVIGYRRNGRDDKAKGVIVPQYVPPKGVTVLQSQLVLREAFQNAAISATIIDLAVRHYLKVYETKKEKLFNKTTTYEVELVKATTDLDEQEIAVLNLVFDHQPTVGERVKVAATQSSTRATKAEKIGKATEKWVTDNGFFKVSPTRARVPYQVFATVLFIGSFFFMPWSIGVLAASVILFLSSFAMPARTAKGAELREYLLGLKMYMKLAEADRLKELQSPHGELTMKVDVNDKTQLVKLYEHLLPYAMLFGIEEDWAKEMAPLYEQPPDWYAGSTAFNAVYFASAISSFGTATSTSFNTPGGSGGSGFSGGAGGGGGGGGGGGW